MAITIETPPTLSGQTENKLRQLESFLWRLSENLNVALNHLESGNSVDVNNSIVTSAGVTSSDAQKSSEYNELKSLIINTAGNIKKTETNLRQDFQSTYVAQSEFGNYYESIEDKVEESATGVVRSFGYDAAIEALDTYKIHTEGYINQGFIDYDEENVPIIGIAIGQNLKSTEVTIAGEKYQQFDSTQNCAFYTANKLSFRINGKEVAYLSNSQLFITDANILNKITFGVNKWEISHTHGFTIKWIGE